MNNNSISYNESVIPHSLVCVQGVSIPPTWIGYDFDIPNDFPGSTNATDLYFHIITLNGTQYYYPPATTNPTTPILVSGNQSSIQSFINASLVTAGYSANDLIFVINSDNTITIWANPSYIINGDEFWMGISVPDNYTNKLFPTISTAYTAPTGNIQAQLVKHRLADGTIIDKFYRVGSGEEVIVDVNSIITAGNCITTSSNYPITDIVTPSSTFSTTNNFYSISYAVIGDNATLETPHNAITRPMFDGESGEFKADDGQTLENILIFNTGLNTSIIINAIVRV